MKKSKAEQIQWLIDWAKEQVREHGNVSMTSTNLDLNQDFEDFAQANLNNSVWKSRIREAAREIGLVGKRVYIADASPSAGLPRFSMVYSLRSSSYSGIKSTSDTFEELSQKINRLFPPSNEHE